MSADAASLAVKKQQAARVAAALRRQLAAGAAAANRRLVAGLVARRRRIGALGRNETINAEMLGARLNDVPKKRVIERINATIAIFCELRLHIF